MPSVSVARSVFSDRARVAVTVAYAVQGLGFAVMLTHIPAYKAAFEIDDDVITIAFLTVCIGAGLGSALAGIVAARVGSAAVVVAGLLVAAFGMLGVGVAGGLATFFTAFVLYGLALGAVDAALNMQGVALERRRGASLLGSFFAANAAGGVIGALTVSGTEALDLGLGVSNLIVAAAMVVAVLVLRRSLVSTETQGTSASSTVPDAAPATGPGVATGVIVVLGLAMVAYPIGDSAVSSWGSVLLHDVLLSGGVIAPLGYAAYQATVIVSRLAADALVVRWGRVRLVRAGGLLGAAGFALVACAPHWSVALVGFAAVGLGIGVVAPMAFAAAGDRAKEVAVPGDLERVTDQALSRLNVFTYVGAVLGGVLTGIFATADHLRLGIGVLALLATSSALLAHRFREASPSGDRVADGPAPVGREAEDSGVVGGP